MPGESMNISDHLQTLLRLETYLKKAVNTRLTRSNLINKKITAEKAYKALQKLLILQQDQIEEKELYYYTQISRNTISSINKILTLKLPSCREKISLKTLSKLIILLNRFKVFSRHTNKNFTMAFDFKTATALVQPFDGSANGLDSFVDSANLLKELTTTDQQSVAVKFLKTRLSGKARLGLANSANTIEAVIIDVQARCKVITSPDDIISKLKITKQLTNSQKLCDEVEALTYQLKAAYLEKNIPVEVAQEMATKKGVEALINGIGNRDTNLILRSNNFADVKAAISKINENASFEPQSTANILTYNNRRTGQNRRNHASQPHRNFNFRNERSRGFRPFRPNTCYSRGHMSNSNSSYGGRGFGSANTGAGRGRQNFSRGGRQFFRNPVYTFNAAPVAVGEQAQQPTSPTVAVGNMMPPTMAPQQQNFLGQQPAQSVQYY